MSKHPIPDWLRSQFSRIEDEVQKLGPCGVFTQMRTVTQTYFEQQAEAAQPPALGGEPGVFIRRYAESCGEGGGVYAKRDGDLCDYHHVTHLQAEIERLTYELNCSKGLANLTKGNLDEAKEEIDQLKARCDELEEDAARWNFFKSWSVKMQALPQSWGKMTAEKMDFMADEAMSAEGLSKPAGSDQ
ncbi:hypothetical protein LCH33_002124 [Pseudomonas amygdali]|uniref:hypothetical protein n=1 Tax=Pseudomonas amygdali TaxID=47877 RepID=UPI000B1AFBE0|nr:hypothetical protein [Pseudomonas amygdali]RMN61801.1 hypothetical protein ALQ57_02648 [Pseudomonas amygdali pv. hibisci]UBT78761.1 hypothetical protein LCH33_002124 [Pseudomonas amygdali]